MLDAELIFRIEISHPCSDWTRHREAEWSCWGLEYRRCRLAFI